MRSLLRAALINAFKDSTSNSADWIAKRLNSVVEMISIISFMILFRREGDFFFQGRNAVYENEERMRQLSDENKFCP